MESLFVKGGEGGCRGRGGDRPICLVSDKEEMMKSVFLYKLVLAAILAALALLPIACNKAQLGETEAEAGRRHQRVFRINQSEMMADIDRTLLLDEPSRLTDKRIP